LNPIIEKYEGTNVVTELSKNLRDISPDTFKTDWISRLLNKVLEPACAAAQYTKRATAAWEKSGKSYTYTLRWYQPIKGVRLGPARAGDDTLRLGAESLGSGKIFAAPSIPPLNQMEPCVTFFPMIGQDTAILEEGSLDLYESLFAGYHNRCDRYEIKYWIDTSLQAEANGDLWRDIFAALHYGNEVAAFTWACAHTERLWCFGCYFGVHKAWRNRNHDILFLNSVKSRLHEVAPRSSGVVFEVRPFDMNLLKQAGDRQHVRGSVAEEKILESYRNLRRVEYFQRRTGGFMAMGADGTPLDYVAPAMREPLVAENTEQMFLMACKFDGTRPDLSLDELMTFVYDQVYGESYGSASYDVVEIAGYMDYVIALRRGVEEKAKSVSFQKVKPPPEVRNLVQILRAEGYEDEVCL
jgi:hypothetical protein